MPTRAFVLCSDEKAVDAITHIFAELDISFELFHEPSFAAKRVAIQHFAVIMVDCDNEENAAKIFTAAKHSSVNQGSVAVAIADGKNGVANGFRLGATLVLAKPVSIEQARGTIRNALAMARKSSPEPRSAANTTLSQTVTTVATAVASPPATTTKLAPMQAVAPPPTLLASPAATQTSKPSVKPVVPTPASKVSYNFAQEGGSPAKSPTVAFPQPDESDSPPALPRFATVETTNSPLKAQSFLLTVVMLALLAAGTYAFSMFNPGFHSLLLSQLERLRSLTGLMGKSPTVPTPPPRRAVLTVPQPTAAVAKNDVSATGNPVAEGFVQTQSGVAQDPQANAAPQKAVSPVILSTSSTVSKPETTNDALVVAEDLADSHVTYRVDPVYPEGARRKGVKGSVILSAYVDPEGNVSAVQVLSGNAQLAAAAMAAVKQWRYDAYYHNGQPTGFQTQVTVRFPQPTQQ